MLKSISTWQTTPPPVVTVVTNISYDQSSRFPLNLYWGGGFSISPSTDFSHFDVGLIQISGQIQISPKSWPEFQQNLISGKNRRWQWQKWKGNEPKNWTWLNQHTGLIALIHLGKRSPREMGGGGWYRGRGKRCLGSSCCEWVCSHRSYFLSLQDFSHFEPRRGSWGASIQISGNVDFSHRLDWTPRKALKPSSPPPSL